MQSRPRGHQRTAHVAKEVLTLVVEGFQPTTPRGCPQSRSAARSSRWLLGLSWATSRSDDRIPGRGGRSCSREPQTPVHSRRSRTPNLVALGDRRRRSSNRASRRPSATIAACFEHRSCGPQDWASFSTARSWPQHSPMKRKCSRPTRLPARDLPPSRAAATALAPRPSRRRACGGRE